MRLVILESPYAGDIRKNQRYARKALKHSLLLGEAPIASHLLYTQRGVLDDAIPEQRSHGIEAGLAWYAVADVAAFYADLGFSMGMLHAMRRAGEVGIPIEIRYIYKPRRAIGERRAPLGPKDDGSPAPGSEALMAKVLDPNPAKK